MHSSKLGAPSHIIRILFKKFIINDKFILKISSLKLSKKKKRAIPVPTKKKTFEQILLKYKQVTKAR